MAVHVPRRVLEDVGNVADGDNEVAGPRNGSVHPARLVDEAGEAVDRLAVGEEEDDLKLEALHVVERKDRERANRGRAEGRAELASHRQVRGDDRGRLEELREGLGG